MFKIVITKAFYLKRDVIIWMKGETFFQSSKGTILEHLLVDDLSPVQISEKMKIGTSTIRDHLKTLEEKGSVEHYFEKAPRGRPKKVYTITENGERRFPKNYELILGEILNVVENNYGEDELEGILNSVARNISDDFDIGHIGSDERAFMEELVDNLEELKLFPRLKEEDGTYILEYKNCFLYDMMDDHYGPLCDMHKKMIENALPSYEVEDVKCKAEGDNTCAHKLIRKDD